MVSWLHCLVLTFVPSFGKKTISVCSKTGLNFAQQNNLARNFNKDIQDLSVFLVCTLVLLNLVSIVLKVKTVCTGRWTSGHIFDIFFPGLGTTFFYVLNASFFTVLLKNATFFCILFSSVWRLMTPKKTMCSFAFFS